jgi:hypothetical protein
VVINERIVPNDHRLVGFDEADTTHIRRERINLLHALCRDHTVLPITKVELDEFIGFRGLVIGILDIGRSDPVSFSPQILDEVMSDESTSSSDEYSSLTFHSGWPFEIHIFKCVRPGTGC